MDTGSANDGGYLPVSSDYLSGKNPLEGWFRPMKSPHVTVVTEEVLAVALCVSCDARGRALRCSLPWTVLPREGSE